jgi:hypothetical protein
MVSGCCSGAGGWPGLYRYSKAKALEEKCSSGAASSACACTSNTFEPPLPAGVPKLAVQVSSSSALPAAEVLPVIVTVAASHGPSDSLSGVTEKTVGGAAAAPLPLLGALGWSVGGASGKGAGVTGPADLAPARWRRSQACGHGAANTQERPLPGAAAPRTLPHPPLVPLPFLPSSGGGAHAQDSSAGRRPMLLTV